MRRGVADFDVPQAESATYRRLRSHDVGIRTMKTKIRMMVITVMTMMMLMMMMINDDDDDDE